MQVGDYAQLRQALKTLHERGVRLAIDDAGSGFASLSLIVELAPEIIKVDMALVRGIDFDPVRRSLVGAIVAVSRELGATVIAEGIETQAELDTLRELGVGWGQGYFLGRPGPLANLDIRRLSLGARFG